MYVIFNHTGVTNVIIMIQNQIVLLIFVPNILILVLTQRL